MDLHNKKIVVTGGAGFLGSYVIEELKKDGVKNDTIIIPLVEQYDLREKSACKEVVKGADVIIHLAANVGGIGLNREKPAELFYDNLIMGVELMNAAYQAGVEKFVTIGTVCAYPKILPVPFKEENLWNGYPEETNAAYGIAKKALLVQAQMYRQQYGFNAIYLLPVNLYGPRDHFEPARSHVIAALIYKIAEAKKQGKDFIEVWGTGKASREFIYAADAAEAIVLATKKYDKAEPVNIGSGSETTIKELVGMLCRLMDFKGEIRWDHTKPDGQPRRMLDVTRAKQEFGFLAKTKLEDGLKNTVKWFYQTLGS